MRPNDLRFFSVVFGLVVISFVSASAYIRYRTLAIDEAAMDISENAAPSILHVSAARVEVHNLQLILERYLDQADSGVFPPTVELEAARARMREEIKSYQNQPAFPGEHELWEGANRDLVHLDDAIGKTLGLLAEHRAAAARKMTSGELREAASQTAQDLMVTIEFNARETYNRARRIRELRIDATQYSWILNILCVLWTAAAIGVLAYSVRRQAALREEQQALAIERAAELEQFAGRVAHDILNPLSVVKYALTLLEREHAPEQRAGLFQRGHASVKRVSQILDGLLKFACAGARPEAGARTDAKEVLAELEPELRAQTTAAGVRLEISCCEPSSVACSSGILISLLTNLTDNAMKYTCEGAERFIAVRVLDRRSCLRFEVEDNGPGLPPGLEKQVFDAGVRGKTGLAPGFGLGLATVKKAVEAHGGRVGVRSLAGQGCMFWFELPTPA